MREFFIWQKRRFPIDFDFMDTWSNCNLYARMHLKKYFFRKYFCSFWPSSMYFAILLTIVLFQECDCCFQNGWFIHFPICWRHHRAEFINQQIKLITSFFLTEVSWFPIQKLPMSKILNKNNTAKLILVTKKFKQKKTKKKHVELNGVLTTSLRHPGRHHPFWYVSHGTVTDWIVIDIFNLFPRIAFCSAKCTIQSIRSAYEIKLFPF